MKERKRVKGEIKKQHKETLTPYPVPDPDPAIVFFPRILESLPRLPRQHSAAIGCTKNYQPIGVTVHLHCADSFEGLLQRCRDGRGCSEL